MRSDFLFEGTDQTEGTDLPHKQLHQIGDHQPGLKSHEKKFRQNPWAAGDSEPQDWDPFGEAARGCRRIRCASSITCINFVDFVSSAGNISESLSCLRSESTRPAPAARAL